MGIFGKYGVDMRPVYVPRADLDPVNARQGDRRGLQRRFVDDWREPAGCRFRSFGILREIPCAKLFGDAPRNYAAPRAERKKLRISRFGAAAHRILELTLAKLGIDATNGVTFL